MLLLDLSELDNFGNSCQALSCFLVLSHWDEDFREAACHFDESVSQVTGWGNEMRQNCCEPSELIFEFFLIFKFFFHILLWYSSKYVISPLRKGVLLFCRNSLGARSGALFLGTAAVFSRLRLLLVCLLWLSVLGFFIVGNIMSAQLGELCVRSHESICKGRMLRKLRTFGCELIFSKGCYIFHIGFWLFAKDDQVPIFGCFIQNSRKLMWSM